MEYERASQIVGRVSSGNRLGNFFYRKTKPGRKIFARALERVYGNFEKNLKTGGYKYVKKIPPSVFDRERGVQITYLDQNFKETKNTIKEYSPDTGERVYFSSTTKRPDGTEVVSSNYNVTDVVKDKYFKSARYYTFYTVNNNATDNNRYLNNADIYALYNNVNDTETQKTIRFDTYDGVSEEPSTRLVFLNIPSKKS